MTMAEQNLEQVNIPSLKELNFRLSAVE